MSLSTGLVSAYNNQDSGSSWLDLANNNDAPITDATWEDDGLQANASGELAVITNAANAVVGSEAGTIVFRHKSLSAFNEAPVRGYFGSNTGAEGGFVLNKFSNTLYFQLRDGVSNHYITANAAQFPAWTTGGMFAILWDRSTNIHDSKKMAFNVSGSHITPVGSSGATSWNSFTVTSSLAMLNDYNSQANHSNSVWDHVYIFNTVKTEAELTSINGNHNLVLADYFYTQGTKTIGINVSIGL